MDQTKECSGPFPNYLVAVLKAKRSNSQNVVPSPVASASLEICYKCKSGPTLDLLYQILWGWNYALCVLISSPGSPDVC